MAYKIGIDARKLGEPGIGEYVRELVHHLAGIDDENRYVLFVGPAYAGEFDELPETFTRIVERSPVYSLRERAALSWRLFRQRLDLYHATHYMLPLWVPSRTVATVHDILHILHPSFVPGRLATLVAQTQVRYSLFRSSRVIAESESCRDDVVEYFEIPRPRVRRIYRGVSKAYAPEPTDRDEVALERLGLAPGYVLFDRDSRRHRNEERVLAAFAAACSRIEDPPTLLMVGEPELSEPKLANLISRLGLDGRVLEAGVVEDLEKAALVRQASLYLYPTLYEGYPTPVVEAMACGTPVITSNLSTIRELAEGAAKLVEPTSLAGLRSAIGWCLQDDGIQRTLAADALERASGFTWHRMAEQTLETYLETLSGDGDRLRILRRSRNGRSADNAAS